MAEVRAGWIINIIELVGELLKIAQRQADRQLHVVIGVEPSLRGKFLGDLGHVTVENLRLRGHGGRCG